MAAQSSLDHVLQSAPRIVGLSNAADIVAEACRVARDLAAARFVVACYACPPQPWERGLHVVVTHEARPIAGPALSALFAIHRRLASRREPALLPWSDDNDVVMRGLACADPAPADGARIDSAYAVPLLRHRSGRLVGEIVVVAPAQNGRQDAAGALAHLAALTSAALENAQRLATTRRDQDRLLLLAETTDETLWDWNLDTGEVWWGGGVQKLLGEGAEPVQPRIEWRDERIHPQDVDRVHETLRQCIGSAVSSWAEHYRFRRADGSWAQVEDRGYVLREASGRAYRVVGVLRDVTPLHETNEALRSNEQRLRAALAASDVANRAKDEFLAMLGHELRNPLFPMRVALQVLRMRRAHSSELEVLERQVGHLSRLVDDLLDVSRITRGRAELRRAPVDLADVVPHAVEIASPLIEQRLHALEVRVPRGIVVDADEARLAQVLSNLLTNAAKYSDPGSKIQIVAERAAASARIRVVDKGVGIAPEMLDHVFELFVQQPQTLDRAQGGLGLGLAIVKSLVEMHGGSVRASSAGPGKGSTFTIELPICETATAPTRPRTLGNVSLNGAKRERILVVDDNPDGAGMLKEALELLGYRVEVAHDGPHALAIADRFSPDLALLDLGLPVMDGYELAELLRQKAAGRDLRLVAITGYGQEEDRQRSAAAGFRVHLVKPVDIEKLAEVIESMAGAEGVGAPSSHTTNAGSHDCAAKCA